MDKEQAAWVAGVMEAKGRFETPTIVSAKLKGSGRQKGCRYVLAVIGHDELVQKFGEITGWRVRSQGRTLKVSCAGEELHKFMNQVWPHLTLKRKRAYQKAYTISRDSEI